MDFGLEFIMIKVFIIELIRNLAVENLEKFTYLKTCLGLTVDSLFSCCNEARVFYIFQVEFERS